MYLIVFWLCGRSSRGEMLLLKAYFKRRSNGVVPENNESHKL